MLCLALCVILAIGCCYYRYVIYVKEEELQQVQIDLERTRWERDHAREQLDDARVSMSSIHIASK
jgi:hypothetical protein